MRTIQPPLRNVLHALAWLAFAFAQAYAVVAPRCAAQPLPPLPALNIDIAETSISGLSSGAFMAVQFAVAHSSIVKGVGVVAGGPYYCAQDDVARATTLCSCALDPAHALCAVSATSTDVAALERATRAYFAGRRIDDPRNVARQRIYVLAGEADPIVPAAVQRQLADYYGRLSVSALDVVVKPGLGHAMPTEAFGNRCSVSDTPYIGRCGFDAAHAILGWIYGALKPKRAAAPADRFIAFDQARYVAATSFLWLTGMDVGGWLYVPSACEQGERCRLHVALHGCRQGQSYLPARPPPGGGLYYGTTFVRHAGYAESADTNRIVVLFPQAVSIPYLNPRGCWDWWGYTGADYATHRGVQIAAIRAMIVALAAGRR